MSNVLIRHVPPDDLELIRAARAEHGTSLQSYLRDAVRAQAVYLRRQAVLAHTSARLQGQPEVVDSERQSVLAAIVRAHDIRADQLSSRPAH